MSVSLKIFVRKVVKKVKKKLKSIVIKVYRLGCKVLPMNKNIILFESNLGRNYTGNPRAILSTGPNKSTQVHWMTSADRPARLEDTASPPRIRWPGWPPGPAPRGEAPDDP